MWASSIVDIQQQRGAADHAAPPRTCAFTTSLMQPSQIDINSVSHLQRTQVAADQMYIHVALQNNADCCSHHLRQNSAVNGLIVATKVALLVCVTTTLSAGSHASKARLGLDLVPCLG
jgi:hypothetical protein